MSQSNPSGYVLSRRWHDWCFRNQGKFSPNHGSLYFWYVEYCNRSEWAEQFEMAPQYAMSAIGVRSYNTYKDTLSDLIDWGFVRLPQIGQNQYAPWLIALSKFDEPLDNPLDIAKRGGSSNFDNPLKKAYNKARDRPRDNPSDKALDDPRDAITINNKPKPKTSNFKPQTAVAEDADADGADDLDSQKKEVEPAPPPIVPPPPGQPPPIPIAKGKVYGDGKLQADLLAYYASYPDPFPLHIYLPFLRHWTQVFQKGKPDLIGTEKWRTMDTWEIEDRLDRWYQKSLKSTANESSSSQPTNGADAGTGQGEIIRTQYRKESFRRIPG